MSADVATAEPTATPSGRRTVLRTWAPRVAVLLAVAATAVGWLAQPTGPRSGDVQERLVLTAPGPNVGPDGSVRLVVTATQDGFAAVDVVFATFLGTIDCTLQTTLRHDGDEIGTARVPCDALVDNVPTTVVTVPPQRDSAGERYEVELSLAPGSTTGPSVWDTLSGPAVVPGYDPQPHRWDALADVVERVDRYTAPWGAPVALAATALLGLASLVLLVLRPRWGLPLLLGLVLVRGLLWASLLPPLQGMDEGAHVAYVQYLAVEGEVPERAGEARPEPPVSDSLVVTTERMGVSALNPTDRPDYTDEAVRELRETDAAAGTESSGATTAAGYPPGYYGPAALFYLAAPDDTVAQVHAIRLWSVLLGVLAAWFAWLFAGEVFRSASARAALVVAVALQPMVAHQFGVVNNDGLAIASGFGCLWIAARLTREGRAPRLMALAGVVLGLGLLAKPYAVMAALPVAAGWVLGKVAHRVRDWRSLVGEPLLAAAGVAATYGVWLVAAALAGIPGTTSFPSDPADAGRDPITYLATQWDPALTEIRGLWVAQMWGSFGWVNTPLPEACLTIVGWVLLALVAAVVGWAVLVVATWRSRSQEDVRVDRLVVVCLASVLGGLALLYGVEYLYFRASGLTNLLQGRYALAVVPALLALPGLLTQRLSRGRLGATGATWLVAAGVAALSVAAVGVVVEHYYL